MKVLNIFILSMLLFAASCSKTYSNYGGGTVGTGLPDSSFGTIAKPAQRLATDLEGILEREDGQPAAGIELEIETELSSRWVLTDSKGHFRVNLPLVIGDEIAVSPAKAKREAGARIVFRGQTTLRLVLDRHGKLRGAGL